VILLDRSGCGQRLKLIFPADVVDDRVVAGPLAAAAVFVFLYAGAVDGNAPIRPSTVLWMSDEAADRTDDRFRMAWANAARRSRQALEDLLAAHGIEDRRWYRENSRETLRDEVFRGWRHYGAINRDESVPTTSSRPAWTLDGSFARLFSPDLTAEELDREIAAWQQRNLDDVARARRLLVTDREQARVSVEVRLPSGQRRQLRPGDSSLLVKGVVEKLAPRLLREPAVVMISESARKVGMVDREQLERIEFELDSATLLPDAILMDLAQDQTILWFVEVVATDGEINSDRQEQLEALAGQANWGAEKVRFLTAFLSRTDSAWRRRSARVAPGTMAWFLSEPDMLLDFKRLGEPASG
jgi:hypothetical protein